MDRRQAKVLIGSILNDKEIVLPRTHSMIVQLEREGMLEPVEHDITQVSDDGKLVILRWIISGAATQKGSSIILYRPTRKARAWFERLKESRRKKDAKLLAEAGYKTTGEQV